MTSRTQIEVPQLETALSGLVERSSGFWIALGRVEAAAYRDRLDAFRIDRPVYICGLARSGSTILLELLAGHAVFASHRYRDFPFVAVPLWWSRFQDLARRGDPPPVERAHKDGMLVTADSPEAMEEMLWMHFFPQVHDPLRSNVIGPEHRSRDFDEFYRTHIRKLLMLRGGQRYLCKGNYNVTRMDYLLALFPDARFIVPVRSPAGHIASLMKQHELFCREGRRDPRIPAYMRRMGHFEFGLHRRPVNLGDGRAAEVEALWRDGEELRGWARAWASLYGFVADRLEKDAALRGATLLVPYEELCRAARETLSRIYAHVGVEVEPRCIDDQAMRVSYPSYYRTVFDTAQTAIIEEETAGVVRRLSSLA